MARHSNGKNTFAVAGWVIAVAVIALLAIIALVTFLVRGMDNADENDAAAPAAVESSSEATTEMTTKTTSSVPTSAAPTSSSSPRSSAPAPSSAAQPKPDLTMAANTLLLLDTSSSMAPIYGPVSQALGTTASDLAADGGAVSLWNYSSPISETATVGYRQNLGFGDGNAVSGTLGGFGTGGVPQTRSAVVAAVANAADQAAGSGDKARVLVVTTGTEQDMDDAQFTAALKDAASKDVSLSVVHVGEGNVDAALKSAADSFTTVDSAEEAKLTGAITKAAGV
ncbi:MAG: hypothetical protein E7K06_00200 [Corynebacterium sp.]|uniref:hypothetical protein n=2 Tax=Corynebacteriaceae TaxID=1653 RepID=UPI0019052B27|nr:MULTISPECIES: hypothetical protein [Corynebacterium]MCG7241346.1 hypothetical protein [Corynebacterium kefirresidentii]MCG7283414.1 hypothetical protein [Corynebacterium kefirresidentii]MDK8584899.1 hypothetical protein [Corynebacterium kefirresidentii]MDK8837008.1 hypothetical protein [Corynebacterium kefirresidentii]MDU3164499.1 hypothetical protein [Corynebacterium sp.]